MNRYIKNPYFNNSNKQDEQKDIEFKQNPFKFQKDPEPAKKPDNNFNSFFNFPNRNEKKDDMNLNTDPMKAQNNTKEKKEWNGDFYYAEINEMHIPIPTFVQFTIIDQIFNLLEQAQNQVNDQFDNPKLKNQFLEKIHKVFIKKNEVLIDKYGKKPQEEKPKETDNTDQPRVKNINPRQEHKRQESGNNLEKHLEREGKLFNINFKPNKIEDDRQSHNSQASNQSQFNQSLIQKYKIHNKYQLNSYENDLKKFLVQSINYSQQNCFKIYQDIQQQIQLKKDEQQVKNKKTNKIKNPYLYSDNDYQINEEQFDKIMKIVDKFGVDRCQVQEKINSALKTETITINFKENKVLKTITYSILYRSICQQELEGAKKFIYKILGYINPKSKGIESENFLLRQIFLQFLCILITNTDYKKQATEFLNTIFSFEFLSSLIFDYMLNSAQKMLKLKNSDECGINEHIECLAKGYYLDLLLIDRSQNVKRSNHSKQDNLGSNLIFIYFEQTLNQDPKQAVYFVINPNDQLLAFV
ncbi:hypothetical protein TTHERM_00378430 (macronuclear) [Tetrahymena thermophila SB210]|uniref:Uncharacterized protein n=1 Tax=Tetrahymena thermophila (strain SB210) TaxID=312017 RepID=Q23FH4_TETTS|nr:hypothetical protein TTHERM_00378430 [Tetrahymena thermophila SB210]EAR95179.1 hypothetical protein TTHERM_00378430 [Tetrahymena thermophila SB210]|eukprot:XP_001015424.1 hypothetical protein TTHERM_00378430 [Tetrahymena thermophila SB210]